MPPDAPAAPVAPPEAGTPTPKAAAVPLIGELNAKTLAVIFLLAMMILLLLLAPWATETSEGSLQDTTGQLAEALFAGRGESFLLLSIVMGVALIGGLFLARDDSEQEGIGPQEEVPIRKDGGGEATPEEEWNGGGAK